MTPFHSFAFFVLCRYFLQAECQTGQILPPQNVSLLWISDFKGTLNWAPPKHFIMENCSYDVSLKTNDMIDFGEPSRPSWEFETALNGGFLHVAVKTLCNGRRSEATVLNVTYPEMVKNVQCWIYAPGKTRCSWDLAVPMPFVRLYYRLSNEDNTVSIDDHYRAPLRECRAYIYAGDLRTGCDLQANITQAVHIVFNGTANETFFRNTFKKYLSENVRLPALEWTVEKSGDKFNISWFPPVIKDHFSRYLISYTECNKPQSIARKRLHVTSAQLSVIPHCPYCITVHSEHDGFNSTPSGEKCFVAETDPNALMNAAAVVPVMLALLAVLTLAFCRRNRDRIFPKVPQPRDFLSDISDNNNKSKLHMSAVEDCKIMLVIDSELIKPGCPPNTLQSWVQ